MSIRQSVVANYLGQGWVALMGIVFIPFYVRALGAEGYGLVGVYTILQAAMTLLDLGITPTLNREMARLQAGMHTAASIRDLLRSLEGLCAMLAVLMVLSVWLCAPWLADGWLVATQLPESWLVESLRVMGFVLAARWLEQLYRGALQGLQDMVWLNFAQAALATLRWGGALLVLVLVSPTVTAFFAWQGLVAVLALALLSVRTYRLLPEAAFRSRFRLSALHEIRGFAGGMFLSALLGFLLIQADKLIISKMLPLEQLGYYTFAAVGAGGLLQLITPMNTAVFPKLTELATSRDTTSLARVYLRSCEWMAAAILPPALLLTVFAEPTLLLWTGDSTLARSVAPLLSMLALGTLLSGFMNLPYMLQLANGWPGLSIRINLVAVCVVVPLLVWAVPRYGAIGAACAWVALNTGYVLVGPHLMHKRLLPEVKWKWYRTAVVTPLAAGGVAAGTLLQLLPVPHSRDSAALIISCVFLATIAIVWSVLPTVRTTILNALREAWSSGR